MGDEAATRYEVRVKSGGPLADLLGGGEILPGEGMTSLANPDRSESLREGEVEIVDSATRKVVWKYKPEHLPLGVTEAEFLDGIDQDLENLSVEEFRKRWGITD